MKIPPNSNLSGNRDAPPPGHTNLNVLFEQWRGKIKRYSMLAAVPALMASTMQDALADDTPGHDQTIAGQRSTGKRPWWRNAGNGRLPLIQRGSVLSPAGGDDNCPGKPIPLGTYTAASPYTDSGNTTGANSTVDYLYFYYYSYYGAHGPDHVYSFTLTGLGANPKIEITARDPVAYKPLIALTSGDFGYLNCRAGTENTIWYPSYDDARGGGDGILSLTNAPLNRRLFLYVDSQLDDAIGSGAYTIKLQDVTVGDGPPAVAFDFDGSTASDVSFFRPSNSNWYTNEQGDSGTRFGLATDKLVPGDYDDDGKTDMAIFRDGQWWWINSTDSTVSVVQFGVAGDIPVPADYTGDGRDEIAVYRDGVWWSLDLKTLQVSAVQFGLASDRPVPADYDGDGKKDRAIFRNGTWWILKSNGEYYARLWGVSTDKPVPADFDGDGKTDIAVYRDGLWYILRSTNGAFDVYRWGDASDTPVPARYAHFDSTAQLAFYRDGIWNITSPGNYSYDFTFGQAGDLPVTAAFNH